ncbi:SigE family RNA polymerase sigma factor [Nocardioides marmoraquaticus]
MLRTRAGLVPPAVVHGRPRSFEELVEHTGRQLHRTALLLCGGDHHAAEDLLQTTYAKVFASWRRVRRSDEPAAYCRTVLTRTWISERRLRRSGERPSEQVGDLADASPDPGTGDPTERLDLLAALQRLGSDDRAVLVLRFYEDLSVTQTAALLRVTEAAVRKRSQRALARLRLLLPDQIDTTSRPEDDR